MQFDLSSNASEVFLLHQLSIISPSLLKILPSGKNNISLVRLP